jgi:uncharacterized protein (UPF0335 family)
MTTANEELLHEIERVERLKEEQKGISEDISEIMKEMKSRGYDMLAVREMLRLRKMDSDKRRDFQNAVEVYGTQLGLL